MSGGFVGFAAIIKPILQEYNKKIFIISHVKKELEKHTQSDKLDTRAYAKLGLEVIRRLDEDGVIDIENDDTENTFADKIFLSTFNRLRTESSILLITQDSSLTADVLQINNQISVKGYPVKVKRINQLGLLQYNKIIEKENDDELRKIYECTNIRSILVIPHGFEIVRSSKDIRDRNYCHNLIIPSDIKRIDDSTFSGWRGLRQVSLVKGLLEIGSAAFAGCSRLEEIVIPDTVISIEDNAFAACNFLTSITIPESVENIGENIFSGSSRVTVSCFEDSEIHKYCIKNDIKFKLLRK